MVVQEKVLNTRFQELAAGLENASAREVIARAVESFGDRVALCTSFQAEGMVILDIASELRSRLRVFTIDTGRLPQETYDLIDAVRDRYGRRGRRLLPGPRGALPVRRTAWRQFVLSQRVAAPSLLRDSQGQSPQPGAGGAGRVDHRPAAYPEQDPGRSGESRAGRDPRRHGQAQSACGVGLRARVGVHQGKRRSLQQAVRTRGTPASGALRAPAPSSPAKTSGPAAGGGRTASPASAVSTSAPRRHRTAGVATIRGATLRSDGPREILEDVTD